MDDTLTEIKRVIRRRKSLLIITPILFLALSIAALYFIEPKYASSTTILVQKENEINPMLLYQMDINMEDEEATNNLASFESFITSRSTIEKLIEELDLSSEDVNSANKRSVVEALRGQISIAQGSSDSYQLSFEDTDPERAKRAVEFLTNYYIETKTTLDRRRAQESVEYFTTKLEELEKEIERQRNEMVSSTSANIKQLPVNSEALQSRLQDINSQIETMDWQLYQLEDQESDLNEFINQSEGNFSVDPLYRLPLDQIPYGTELADLLDQFDEMDDNYTESYPQLKALQNRIKEVVNRIPPTMESDKNRLNRQRQELLTQREQVIENMERSYVAEQQNSTQQSGYVVYQELYNDMKVRLEQAQMTSEISEKASGNFLVLDEAQVPEEPSSPNRNLIIAAGLIVGFILGGLMVIVAEMLDNTVRTEKDFQIDKPIIAYLSDGRV